MTTASRSHAPFAPSAMQRIELCPASQNATAGIPEQRSEYALDGEEAHTVLAYGLQNKFRDADTAYRDFNAKNNVGWTHRKDTYAERIESIQECLDEVWTILDTYEDAQLFIETKVQFPSKVTTDCWGTADIIIVVPSMDIVYILDFKYGAGVYVEVEDNLQCGTYATSALYTIPAAAACSTVVVIIVQPRAFSPVGTVRTDIHTAHYFKELFRAKIDNIIWQTQQPNAPFVPGPKQCQFCPIKTNCPAREAAALAVVSDQFRSFRDVTETSMPVVQGMTPARVSFIMNAKELMQGWFNDVETLAFEMLKSGTTVPGFKLVEAQARRKWYNPDEEATAQMLMALTGYTLEDVYPRKLIGMVEADTLVGKSFKERAPKGQKKQAAEEAKNMLAMLTSKESSGNLTLVPDSDNRPAVNLAQKVFANVTVIPTQGT